MTPAERRQQLVKAMRWFREQHPEYSRIRVVDHGWHGRAVFADYRSERLCVARVCEVLEQFAKHEAERAATAVAAKTYTVRIEWQVTYYCDTTVEASSPEEAKRIAAEDPDYDNQHSYDDGAGDGSNSVAGVCEGDMYDHGRAIGGRRAAEVRR